MDVHLYNERILEEVPLKVIDHGDMTYTAEYTPLLSGPHKLTVNYGGFKVPDTPIKFEVKDGVDVSKIKVNGLSPSKY